jgi:hypothetical protein
MKPSPTSKIILLSLVFCLIFCSCGKADKEDETTEAAVPEETTYETPPMETISPATYTKEIPFDIEMNYYDDVDKSSFKEVDEDDAVISGMEADNIYQDERGYEYYILSTGAVAVTFIEGDEAYSGYYRTDGSLQYLGSSETGWYFTEDGTLDLVSYTYVNPYNSEVVSYYTPDGTRTVISAAGTYYNDDYSELTLEEQIAFLKRIGDTSVTEEETTGEQ